MAKITSEERQAMIMNRATAYENSNNRPAEDYAYHQKNEQIYNLKVSEINPSEFNNFGRSLDEDDLEILADSIAEFGVKEPIRVYADRKDGYRYTIISGHRRYAAVRLINEKYDGVTIDAIPSIIVKERPTDVITEKLDVAQSNLSRKKSKDLENEVKAAEELWQDICDLGKKEEYTEKLKKNFINRFKSNPNYVIDPDKYLRDNFRDKFEFIRYATGLDISHSTIKRVLAKSSADDKPKRKQTAKAIQSKCKSIMKIAFDLYGVDDKDRYEAIRDLTRQIEAQVK